MTVAAASQPPPSPPAGRRSRVDSYVVAYLRVSTERQATEGLGLEVQEQAIRAWAKSEHLRVRYVCTDEGRSGSDDVIDRPGLAEALGHVKAGRARSVAVFRLDRLARDLVLQEWLRAEILRLGGQLRSTSSVEDLHLRADLKDPTAQLVRTVLAAVAVYEASMIRLRMQAGKARKRESGGYTGGGPRYGWRAEGRELVKVPEEQRVITLMRQEKRKGAGVREIVRLLNERQIPARRGGRWHPQTVARVLADE